ncbi:cardioacceleratory peptide receptor [Copidosoma floridanum]|uniref:cardioacceleratory peptide receptor n=1 Tax=Copidosoma floridanum TaxID=29053 RepID=UPI0006C9649B|nr:cardioacceleratory peptide receptor [Copidosoma floridanum]
MPHQAQKPIAPSSLRGARPLALALESDLVVFSPNGRLVFQLVLWPTVIAGVIGNGAVLWRILVLPGGRFALLKPFYRCALVSFAVSDLVLLVASGVHTLAKLSCTATLLWTLPGWSCAAIPFLQTCAIVAGSFVLASVAVDRYRALIPDYPRSEGPTWFHAVFFNGFVWLFAMAVSYPVVGIYEIDVITVVREDSTVYDGRLCSTDQEHTAVVYTALFVVIFAPLALVFLLVHVLLALNIWGRRQKQQQQRTDRSNVGSDSQSMDFSSSAVSSSSAKQQHPIPLPNNHAKRKKRTVKVILVLMVVFLAGRLPSWAFLLCKQHMRLPGGLWHYLQTAFTGLSLLSAALDPFLYAFLCEALSLVGLLRSYCAKVKESATHPRTGAHATSAESPAVIVPRGPYNF